MWPFAVKIEPEPVLAELGPVGTITRTEAFSARTKAGSRPPDGFGCSGGVVGFAAGAWVAVGAAGFAGGSVGFGAACPACPDEGGEGRVAVAAAATGLVAAVAVAAGRAVGVGVARLSATARSTS